MMRRDPKLTAETMPPRGTVYAIPLADGDYGAVRVLETRTPEQATEAHLRAYFVFAAATAWRGNMLPDISNAELGTILRAERGDVVGIWSGSSPPRDFQIIGRLPQVELEPGVLHPRYSAWEWLAGEIGRRLPRQAGPSPAQKAGLGNGAGRGNGSPLVR
jgi:hypothetical protein